MQQVIPTGPAPAKILIVGEFPGDAEVREGAPFVGTAGQELNRMLQEAGIFRNECFVTTVSRIQPPDNDIEHFVAVRKRDITPRHRIIRDKFVTPEVYEGLDLLQREIALCRPNVIIACGNLSLWALTGNWGITSWRGSTLECDLELGLDYKPVVVPIINPGMVLKQWSTRRIVIQDLRRAKSASMRTGLIYPDYRFITRPDFGTALTYLNTLLTLVSRRPTPLAVDIETRAGHIACIGFAWSKLEAICIPLMCTERADGYWTLNEEAELVYRMIRLLTHPNCLIRGQNFLYDAQYLWRHWHIIPNLHQDTMISQHTAFSNMDKGLDFLSSMYAEFHQYWKDEGKDWDPSIPEDRYWTYNCKDAVITFEVAEPLNAVIQGTGLTEPHEFQQKLFFPVLRTMNKGIRPNLSLRSKLANDLFQEIQSREQWLYDVLGYQLNVKSAPQMQDLFYEQLKQKPLRNRKTGTPTLDDEALGVLMAREPLLKPVIRKILEIRSLGVFLSTYVNGGLDYDGRYRCSFKIAGAETFRFKSSKNAFGTGFNFQNVPSGGEEDGLTLPNLRRLFLPDPGKDFFDIDLNAADLRIVVWESDEPEMKAIFAAGLDPYTEIAKEFYHDPSITKKDPRRQTFKAFAHGTNYLGTAKGLADRLGLSVHQAESTQRWYFDRFPRIKRWQEDLKDQVAKRGMVENVFGYRTYFFDRIEGTIFNQAAAWIPQSTVACLINRAYVKIERLYGDEVDILIQVHDSLAGQYPTVKREFYHKAIVEAAQIPLPYSDPCVIPVGIKWSSESWGDCK